MVIDSSGKLFEERRKSDRRVGDDRRKKDKKVGEDKRQGDRRTEDRRNPKNAYRP